MPVWLDTVLKIFTALSTATIACAVGYISYLQWKTAQEKLRFDLYERRYAIYQVTLEYVRELAAWKGSPEQNAVADKFGTAYFESSLLFPPSSTVPKAMGEIHDIGGEIMRNHFSSKSQLDNVADTLAEMYQHMAPYIVFHSL